MRELDVKDIARLCYNGTALPLMWPQMTCQKHDVDCGEYCSCYDFSGHALVA